MQHPPRPIIRNAHKIPSIGVKPYDEKTTFELGPFKFHPPRGFDQTYAMLMFHLASGLQSVLKTVHAFTTPPAGTLAQAYLVEECALGKAYDLVMVGVSDEGELQFVVARPVEDDPAAKDPKH